jgi:hypothetical protein
VRNRTTLYKAAEQSWLRLKAARLEAANMRRYNTIMGILSGLLLLGCVPSIHPIFTPQDVVFDKALVGTWATEEGDETLAFSKGKDNSYRLVYTDKQGKQAAFQAHLTQLDGHRFLDLFPDEIDLPQNDFFKLHLVPTHTFLRVLDISADELRISVVNPSWLGKYLKDHPEALKHERRENDSVVLTAPTQDLQKFFLKHLETPKAYGEPSTLKRVAEGEAKESE